MEDIYGLVYCYLFENRKIYVGQTINLKKRIVSHRAATKSSKSRKSLFHCALSKYGFDEHRFFILETANSKEMLSNLEMKWIEILDSFGKNGYNLTRGGEGGLSGRDSPKAREVVSCDGENVIFYGTLTEGSEATGAGISRINRCCSGKLNFTGLTEEGKPITWRYKENFQSVEKEIERYNSIPREIWKRKSFSKKGKMVGDKNPNYGKKYSREILEKMSKSRFGKYRNSEHWGSKKCVLLNTGKVFDSLSEVDRRLGILESRVSSCCAEKIKKTKSRTNMWLYFSYYKDYISMDEDSKRRFLLERRFSKSGNCSQRLASERV